MNTGSATANTHAQEHELPPAAKKEQPRPALATDQLLIRNAVRTVAGKGMPSYNIPSANRVAPRSARRSRR
jgi:hypothetical protein